MRRAFMTWTVRARKGRDLNQRLEVFEKEHNERLLADAFASWHTQKRERDLKPIEMEVALRHEDGLLFDVFDKWAARGRLLRAVQFDQQRLVRSMFPKWKTALKRQQKLKVVEAEHDARLVCEYCNRALTSNLEKQLTDVADGFAMWKAAYRAKIAKRPA
jgi:hypothetical protein